MNNNSKYKAINRNTQVLWDLEDLLGQLGIINTNERAPITDGAIDFLANMSELNLIRKADHEMSESED